MAQANYVLVLGVRVSKSPAAVSSRTGTLFTLFFLVRFGVLLSCTIPGARELGDDVTVNSYDIMKNV